MHRSSILVAAIAATGLLTLPAGALAAGSSLIAGPVKAKGYTVSLTATDNGATDTVSVMPVQTARKSQQMRSWSFSGVAVSIRGAKATLKGSLGAFGKLDAKVA